MILDQDTLHKLTNNQLDTAGLLLVSLANMAAQAFTECSVYVGAVQETTQAPALFVELAGVHTSRLLANEARHQMQFIVSYLPKDRQSATELGMAALKLQQEILKIPFGEGEMLCRGMQAEIVEGRARLKGQVVFYEKSTDQSPMIITKELYV